MVDGFISLAVVLTPLVIESNNSTIEAMKDKLDAVYDVTLGYPDRVPSLVDLVCLLLLVTFSSPPYFFLCSPRVLVFVCRRAPSFVMSSWCCVLIIAFVGLVLCSVPRDETGGTRLLLNFSSCCWVFMPGPQVAGDKEWDIHVHVSRIPIADVPVENVAQWCDERYVAKDALLSRFEQFRRFTLQEGEQDGAVGPSSSSSSKKGQEGEEIVAEDEVLASRTTRSSGRKAPTNSRLRR